MSRINEALREIDRIITDLDSPDGDARCEAAGKAQYAFCGSPSKEKGNLLAEALAARLVLKVNGHAEPVEPDHYVRERCADALRLASDRFDVGRFLPLLELSAERDPHEWVRYMAKGALEALGKKPEVFESPDLPLPKSWTTRPAMPAVAQQAKDKRPNLIS